MLVFVRSAFGLPERGFEPKVVALLAHKAATYELGQLEAKAKGGLLKFFRDPASGWLKENPFPKEAISRSKGSVRKITGHTRLQSKAGQILQGQPVDVFLPGSS